MATENLVILIGNVVADLELRSANGTPVVDMRLAVNNSYKKNGEEVKDTLFIDVVLWSKLAEVCSQHLTKGSPVYVLGKLREDRWEKDGVKQSRMRIVANRVQFLGSKNGKTEVVETTEEVQVPDSVPF